MRLSRRAFLAGVPAAVVGACTPARRVATRGSVATSTTSTTVSAATSTTTGGPARFVQRGSAERAQVAFTFHGSGDRALFDALLAAAQRAGAPITIFAVGRWLDADPTLADAIARAGHELANHTYTHPALATLSRSAIASEITRCRDAIARHGGVGNWFRPSGVDVPTAMMLEEAGRAGYATVVGYDVDPRDYQDPGRDAVLSRVVAGLRNGAIVSLHTGHEGTVAAFEPMVAAARDKGLTPVLVRELLA